MVAWLSTEVSSMQKTNCCTICRSACFPTPQSGSVPEVVDLIALGVVRVIPEEELELIGEAEPEPELDVQYGVLSESEIVRDYIHTRFRGTDASCECRECQERRGAWCHHWATGGRPAGRWQPRLTFAGYEELEAMEGVTISNILARAVGAEDVTIDDVLALAVPNE
jgi:hypothetical protein